MGLEYNYYLLPNPNSFLPQAAQVLSFLHQAETKQWLQSPSTGWMADNDGVRVRRHALLLADVGGTLTQRFSLGIRIGFPLWLPRAEPLLGLELHLSQDYVYHVSESVNSFGDTVDCGRCGARLDYEPQKSLFDVWAIHANCPRCGTAFDPSSWPATYIEGWTGQKKVLLGGATYRFALMVGNVPAEEQERFSLGSDFLALFHDAFGCAAHGFADFS